MSDVWSSKDAPWDKPEGYDENARPFFLEEKANNNCRKCGAPGHFARDCPNDLLSKVCFNCGAEGHSKAECLEPRKFSGACYNCGEEGHSKVDCPNPRVFKGTCRFCYKVGHTLAECPDKPADICRNCKEEGHLSKDCKENRVFDMDDIADKSPEEAWDAMKKASDERDLNEFRDALQVYSKAVPDATFVDIEKKMREDGFKIYLIALERDPMDVITLIDLQGKLDRQYLVGLFFDQKAQRKNLAERWPSDPADNIERLSDAGFAYDRGVKKCKNCGEMGHGSRACKQERVEVEHVQIKCVNCNAIGHRMRDCKEPRRTKYGCRNCGVEGHNAKECPEPRPISSVECRRCNQLGHFAKDCPLVLERGLRTCHNCGSEDHMARDCDQPRDESKMTCRNCDQVGHMSRDCPKPRDYSRVKCNRCGKMGHTAKRCKLPEDSPPTPKSEQSSPADGGWGEWGQTTGNDSNAGDGDDGWGSSARKGKGVDIWGEDEEVADINERFANQEW